MFLVRVENEENTWINIETVNYIYEDNEVEGRTVVGFQDNSKENLILNESTSEIIKKIKKAIKNKDGIILEKQINRFSIMEI